MSDLPDLPVIRKEQRDAMMLPFPVETSGLTWLAVHRNLSNVACSPRAELKLVERVEQQESPHGGI